MPRVRWFASLLPGLAAAAAVPVLLGTAQPLSAQLTITTRTATVTLAGYVQPQYTISSVGQPDAVDDVLIRRARLQFDIRFGKLDGRIEPDFGGGGAGVGPADLFGRITFAPEFKLSVGQFKRAFSIFELSSDSDLPDIERDARIEGVNDCPGGVGGSCSFSRVAERLQFDDRDIGLRVEGDLGKRFQYLATLTNGQGRNNADVNDAKSPSARLTFVARPDLRIGAFAAVHDYLPAPTAADSTPDTHFAQAAGADLELGTWRDGFHLLAGAVGGDNWLGGSAADFWAAQLLASYYVRLKEGGTLAGIEPMLRVDRTSVDGAPGGIGQLHTLVVTPGLGFYVTGKTWLGFNLDWYHPTHGFNEPDDWSFKSQVFFYF